MKASPFLPFVEEFQGKGLFDFSSSSTSPTSSSSLLDNYRWIPNPKSVSATSISKVRGLFHVGSDLSSAAATTETNSNNTTTPAARSPSPSPAAASSSTTLSSSLNSGGWEAVLPNSTAVEDWKAVLPESGAGPASPGQEQSILRLIMGDIEDPSVGLSKLLQGGGGGGSHHELDFGGGFGNLMDNQIQGLSFEQPCFQDLPFQSRNNSRQVNPFSLFPDSISNVNVMPFAPPPVPIHLDEKPQIYHPHMMNQNQTQFLQNSSFLVPLGFNHLQEHPLSSPPLKRINLGATGSNLHHAQQFQQRPSSAVTVMKQNVAAADELATHQQQPHQQAIIDQLYKAVELIESGNTLLAQEILARLNHQQLSPIGKPFHKAAFYLKEALQSLLLHTNPSIPFSPFSVIYKIGAYKSFCDVSPVVKFANFTSNQAFLEAFEGCSSVHILSFDVGFGGEWASLMQELALRSGGPPSLKITAFASPSANDELELSLTQENLKHFACELNIGFEFDVVNVNCLNTASIPINSFDGEAIAVNLPIGAFLNYPSYLPRALRFLKQLSPKIVVSLDRGCDRMDAPFPNHVIHTLQSYTTLLESLDAVNVNLDVLQKIERYLIQPGIEKIVSGRHQSQREKTTTVAWRSLFLSSGFSPLMFSNFNESQAECLVQRTLVRGFHVEKRQSSSLVLCWNRKELISVSAWTC